MKILDFIKSNNFNLVKAELENGFNCAYRDERGKNILHHAVYYGSVDLVALCFKKRPSNINRQDKVGYTPLHIACQCGYLFTIEYLLSKEADYSIECYQGYKPLNLILPTIGKILMNLG